MRLPDDKKNNHYGVLCGLRASALGNSESDSSRASTPEPPPKDEIYAQPNQRRPQSLTLPFENRDRESHLVSDEEFDRIVRQAEFENPMPPPAGGRTRNVSSSGLKRSISTARNTTFLRQRPASADVSTMLGFPTPTKKGPGQLSSMSRDSTLTALPKPPTMNELAVYPAQRMPQSLHDQQAGRTGNRKQHLRNLTISNDRSDESVFNEVFQAGHKRNRSAALVVESVKKRLKRSGNSPRNDQDSTNDSPRSFSSDSYPTAHAASVQYQYGQPVYTQPAHTTPPDANETTQSARPILAASSNLKKSLLTRTWSRTKQHAKKFSISSPASNSSRPSISDPIPFEVRPESAQSMHTMTSGVASTATSRYYASAEPSPRDTQDPSRAATPNSETSDQKFEFISGPATKKNVLTRMGAPPRRSELNTVVARQQSRIVDLTLMNSTLVQQVESLRHEVADMRVKSQQPQRLRNGSYSTKRSGIDSDYGYPLSGQENYGQLGMKRKSDGTASAWSSSVSARRRISSGRVQKDPEGWRHIMGVAADQGGERMELDGDPNDKRKTWMTCDSDA